MMIQSAKSLTVEPEDSGVHRSNSLWIRTAAGPQIGFGHLKRCLILADSLREDCVPLFLLDRDDLWSQKRVAAAKWNFCSRGLDEIWSVMPDPVCVLIDTRLTSGLDRLIVAAKDRGIPTISIHDLGLNPIPSDTAIDGSIAPWICNAPAANERRYSGTEFMVLDRVYGRFHQSRKEIRKTIRSVFISLGGGNSESIYSKVLEALKRWARDLNVIAVPGFIPAGAEKLMRQDWSPLHIRWEAQKIEGPLFDADLAITAGGLAAYEALCAGTPLMALSHDSLQQLTITALADKGACLGLGPGEELDPIILCTLLSRLDSDRELRKHLSLRGKEVIDGRGIERVSQIIRQSIQPCSAAGPGRISSVASVGF